MSAKQPGPQADKPFDPATLPADSLRPPMRDEDPRDRAAKRMAELRGLHGDGVLDDGIDKFYIDRSIIPDGWDYEWKRHTLLNKEDPSYQVALARGGWEPVPTSRHPHMMPFGTSGDSPILLDGQILMERPLELSDMARKSDFKRARDQVRIKEAQLNDAPGPGHFERNNKGQSLASIKKSMVPMQVPE